MGGRGSASATSNGNLAGQLENLYPDNEFIKKTPFPVDEKSYSLIQNEAWKKRAKQDLGETTPNLDRLTAAQPAVLTRDLNDILKDGFSPAKAGAISVLETKGKLIVVDGTHRATAAKLSGRKEIRVHLYSTKKG